MKLRIPAFATVAIALLGLALAGASAQDSGAQNSGALRPDTNEIESAKSANVAFVNYEGPQPRIDSLADIKGLGAALGREMAAAGARRSGAAARYQVIRAADPSVKEGLDADILLLGPDAQVDHIRNLRWIIAGYLVQAWGYAEKDAYTLATFITVYDAVHRGDMKYFAAKYKAVVMKELTPETAGLSLTYAEWPGRSRIVIPLSSLAARGKLGAVDTGAVSDKAVTDSLKTLPDKGVADRQALVDVKEREAAQKQAELDRQKADLAAAEKKLAADKAKAEADRAALEADKAAAATAAGATGAGSGAESGAAGTGGTADSGGAAATAAGGATAPTAELSTKEAAVKAEEAAVAARQADLDAKKADVAAGEADVAAKKDEAAADRKDITADQKAVIAAEVAAKGAAAAAGVFLIRVGNDANHLAQVVLVDADKGGAIRSSRINTLHLRSLTALPDSFVAVSGLEGKPGGVKLVRLDGTSLESVAEGKADMFPESAVLVSGESIYAIVKAPDGQYYPARFAAADLAEKARAKDAVMPWTLVGELPGGLAVQGPGGSFALLRPDTLEKIKELKP